MKNIFNMLTLLFLFGCSGFIEVQKLSGGYALLLDEEEGTFSVSFSLGSGNYIDVVSNSVFAVGYNEDFIIVKQHPAKFPNPPDKSITNYFIVPLKNKLNQYPDENRIGPLSKLEFEEKRKKMGVSKELMFTKIMKELE